MHLFLKIILDRHSNYNTSQLIYERLSIFGDAFKHLFNTRLSILYFSMDKCGTLRSAVLKFTSAMTPEEYSASYLKVVGKLFSKCTLLVSTVGCCCGGSWIFF